MNKDRKVAYGYGDWLPTSKKEMDALGWEYADIILFSGDAYIDHPSFGTAILGRLLQKHGFRVAIVPQPNWRDDLRDFKKFGKPRLFFGVTAGAMDSMVNHYTANKRLRSNDAYTPGGKAGNRPDYATVVYSNILKNLFPEVPLIIGGVEASQRRLTHYDYWKDQLLPSVLIDSRADILVYGMGEKSVLEIANRLNERKSLGHLWDLPQIAYAIPKGNEILSYIDVPDKKLYSFEECIESKEKYAENFRVIEEESNKIKAVRLIENSGNYTIVVNPPYPLLSAGELDSIYDLPFTRLPHPRYSKKDTIPAYEMIRHSITLHRGCFGGCSFCTISMHQGKFIASRSEESIMKEVGSVTKMPDFKGYISDLGGPSANMYGMAGKKIEICEKCKRPSCLVPAICPNLDTNPARLLQIYKQARKHRDVKKAFVGSGIRYDLFVNDMDKKEYVEYVRELIAHHVSGRLKVAPEHTNDSVLKMMRKPSFSLYRKLKSIFEKVNREAGLNQQLIPYFISSHPGCENPHMAELAAETKDLGYRLEQVQDFTPTPMTLATTVYYTGINPYTGEKVFVAREDKQKKDQQKFFFWYKKEYRNQLKSELIKMGRKDLVEKLFHSKPQRKKSQKTRNNFQKTNSRKIGIME
jgi:uncharacterized radical SAM protein YgiQ